MARAMALALLPSDGNRKFLAQPYEASIIHHHRLRLETFRTSDIFSCQQLNYALNLTPLDISFILELRSAVMGFGVISLHLLRNVL